MPKIIQINKFESEDWLQTTASILDSSGVIGFPTDTFYGLGANPFDQAAIDKIFAIKFIREFGSGKIKISRYSYIRYR